MTSPGPCPVRAPQKPHLVTASPGGGGGHRRPCPSTGRGDRKQAGGPGARAGLGTGHPWSPGQRGQGSHCFLLAPSLSSAGPRGSWRCSVEAGRSWSQSSGRPAGLEEGPRLTCPGQDVDGAASLCAPSASPFPPGLPACLFPPFSRSAVSSLQPRSLALSPNSALAARTV